MATLIKGNILHFPNTTQSPQNDAQYIVDGGMLIENGKVVTFDTYASLVDKYPDAERHDFSGKLIVPGFIDTHLHFPQTEMIARYGEQLLDWLNRYTFPTERKFEDPVYAQAIARFFLNQLWQNGTTTCMAYATVHKSSAEALFNLASEVDMHMITGKVCMDRHCPDWLQDTAESAYEETAELIAKWHKKGRNKYAITPRFAPTSTHQQMQKLGDLMQAHPDVYMQTHLSENKDEVAWVKSLFPNSKNYLDVYDSYGMVTDKAVFGHCIYLDDDSWRTMAEKNAIVAFCPRSNLFLGSGLYQFDKAQAMGVQTTLATDVAGGDSFSMLKAMGEAYKVCQLQQINLDPLHGLYLMTQGAAHALGIETEVGNFNAGSYADFTVLDPHFNDLSRLRINEPEDPADVLFALSFLAEQNTIAATWIAGKPVYSRTGVTK